MQHCLHVLSTYCTLSYILNSIMSQTLDSSIKERALVQTDNRQLIKSATIQIRNFVQSQAEITKVGGHSAAPCCRPGGSHRDTWDVSKPTFA